MRIRDYSIYNNLNPLLKQIPINKITILNLFIIIIYLVFVSLDKNMIRLYNKLLKLKINNKYS